MAARPAAENDNLSSSSAMLPFNRRSQSTSISSLSGVSHIEKEALSHALDQIHITASQSGGLTTFNQFTAPPLSSSGGEGKGIASDLQGGLSGLYSRLRATVGGIKEPAGLMATSAENEVDEASSTKSSKALKLTPALNTKHPFQSNITSSPSTSLVTVRSESEETKPSARPHAAADQGPRGSTSGGECQKPGLKQDHTPALPMNLKPAASTAGTTKPAIPLTQAVLTNVVSPSVIEVNVSAASTGRLTNERGRTTNSASINAEHDSLERNATGNNNPRYQQSRFPEDFTSVSAIDGLGVGRAMPEGGKHLSRRMNRITEARGETRDASNHLSLAEEELISPKTVPIALDGSNCERDGAMVAKEAGGMMSAAKSIAENNNTLPPPKDSAPADRSPPATRSRALRSLPGFSLSRGSSTDTASGTFMNTSQRRRSVSPEHIDEGGRRPLGTAKIKATATIQTSGDSRGVNVVLSQIKSKVLSKEYWMRDENAKDCFYCGDVFSTFRRKHHCRTCGQIFDAKCTSLVSGSPFGQSGSIRVCKQCESLINTYDDSSEFSDDGSIADSSFRLQRSSKGISDTSPARIVAARKGLSRDGDGQSSPFSNAAPTMAILASRRIGDGSNRRMAIVEMDADRRLPRPGSSRSLKSSGLGPRQFHSTHRRHHSRNLLQRGLKNFSDEAAPFHHDPDTDTTKIKRLPAFHSDNIIDPDLAAFLSDEESSGEEQVSIMSALNSEGVGRNAEHDRSALSGLYSSSKKARSRIGDKSVSGFSLGTKETDEFNTRLTNAARNPKRRNLSISSNVHLRPSPRNHRFSTASPAMSSYLQESFSSSALEHLSSPSGGMRVMRSASMKGIDAPAVELNSASIQHVRRLLRQLLQDSGIKNVGSWERALIPILLQATDDVDPDVQNGDDIDIRHYVKLKKVPGGRPGDTSYVSGLVFTKNLALKSMPRSITHPNILILTFPLEYARHQQHFMSLEPVIRQEKEYLQNLVHRIAALRPQLLLVQRNISGLALAFLEQANIATAYNVKPSVLEAVSRCTQSRIITSVDKLAIKSSQTSQCAKFYLKTYVNEGRKKTYMWFSGCPKELGCTIVLRGGDRATLAEIKRVTEFMIYVVYNLKLETSLMRDEFALIPSYTGEGSMSPDKTTSAKSTSAVQREYVPCMTTSTEPNGNFHTTDSPNNPKGSCKADGESLKAIAMVAPRVTNSHDTEPDEIQLPEDIPMPTFYSDMVEKHSTRILSASPFVKFMQPHLLMRAREQEQRLLYLKNLCDQDIREGLKDDENTKHQKFMLIKPETIHGSSSGSSRKFKEVLHAVHEAEYDKALHNYRTQKKQWEAYIAGNFNLFDPFAHQNIAVLYSVVCTVTTVPCSGPDLLALGYYNEHEVDEDFAADCTLGQYVEDLCLGANTVCTANGCERKMFEHHRQYVHGSAQINVTVENHACELRGLQDSILMWSVCRICGKSTQVLAMSDNTWKYSFGKYLELSFWSSELHARAGICPHDLHRDHLRYFGFKDIALRVQYDPITILEISVPRTRITWKVANDLKFKNEVYLRTEERINKFMLSVKARIKSIKIDSVISDKVDSCKDEIERLMKRANEEHQLLIRKLQEKYMNSKYFEIIPLNRAIRATQEKVAEWDNIFTEFDNNYFPSEKDIRRLATLQLKKMFLDRDDSVTSLATDEGANTPPLTEGEWPEKQFSKEASPSTVRQSESPENYEVNKDVECTDRHRSAPTTSVPRLETSDEQPLLARMNLEEVGHLDLAVPMSSPHDQVEADTLIQPETQSVSPTSITDASEPNNNRADQTFLEPPVVDLSEKSLLQEAAPSSAVHSSSIPCPFDANASQTGSSIPPAPQRMQPQSAPTKREVSSTTSSISVTPIGRRSLHPSSSVKNGGELINTAVTDHATKHHDKKLSDRLRLSALKSTGQSMIPRSITSRRIDSRVSTLAKHFEQLSREFEKERLRERRLRAAKSKQARAYPVAASKPIVEIYRNVDDAVEEQEASDEEKDIAPLAVVSSIPTEATRHLSLDKQCVEQSPDMDEDHQDNTAEDTAAEDTSAETDDNTQVASYTGSDAEEENIKSDEELSLKDHIPYHAVSQDSTSNEAQLDLKLDLPKHEKSSLMRMLTNFWAERSASGWPALEYPLYASDHVFADSDIIIREDEPSSLISFALGSEDYKAKLQSIQEKSKNLKVKHNKKFVPDSLLTTEEQKRIECSLLQSTGTHLKYQFQEGSARMLCNIYYVEQFDAVRRKCGVSHRIVESLSRCLKWDSKGGKTKSVFLKTLDDRLVLKSLSQIETQAFLRFAPAYFQLMGEALFHELPSVIAKMLGFYQIVIKNPVTGVEFNCNLLVMENLFYDRTPTRIFDLKGSMRNRRIQSTGEKDEVLLDENMVEFIYESPLFVREHSKRLLRSSVFNDTLFLARQSVMDYSLMVAIDENRKELVVGMIDCIRTYTWDKKLESWLKDRGKNRPTVMSPKEYKVRFREAMERYILQAPNCWHQFQAQPEVRSTQYHGQPGEAYGEELESNVPIDEE